MSTSVENRYVEGNFAPVTEEVEARDLAVTGSIPTELVGRYLRNGPNPIGPVDMRTHHWFVGTGMVHGIRLRDGRAEWYRNRYVRGDAVAEAQGREPLPGPRHPFFGGGAPNTNVIGHAGATWALVEAGGLPVEMTYDLESVRYIDFDGAWPGAFSAHPKRDPITGELHVVGYYWEWDHVKYVVVRPDGTIRKVVEIPVPGKIMLHDSRDHRFQRDRVRPARHLPARRAVRGLPVPVPLGGGLPGPGGGAAPRGSGRGCALGRRRALLRVPPAERLRPARRPDRPRRSPPSQDVLVRLQRA